MVYNKEIKQITDDFNVLGDDSRLWIFQADRELEPHEIDQIQSHLETFLVRWTSHNRQLIARGTVAYNHFIIIALDETKSSSASGCSIDSMTHQIQAMSQHLGVNLLDRSTFYFKKKDGIVGLPMHELSNAVTQKEIESTTPVFNNLIKTKGELNSKWIVPLEESWHKRFL